MSVTGLTQMHQLIDAAIDRFDRWRQTSEAAEVPAPRLENIRDKLQALRNCASAGLVRTALEHVTHSMMLAGFPVHILEPHIRQLVESLEKRMAAADQIVQTCDECGSLYFAESSPMTSLCPECSHFLYGYETCQHTFVAGRCSRCHWDGSVSPLKKMRESSDQ